MGVTVNTFQCSIPGEMLVVDRLLQRFLVNLSWCVALGLAQYLSSRGEYIGNHGFHITYGGVICCPVSMFPSFLGEMLEGTEAAMTARHERIHG